MRCAMPRQRRLAYGHATGLTVDHATLRKRFGKADPRRTQSVAKGLSFRAYAIGLWPRYAIAYGAAKLPRLCDWPLATLRDRLRRSEADGRSPAFSDRNVAW
ncbi:MAG: hypothetical protein F6K55_29855 [Moorea sp. SIO4A3]|nr:hypothetical protein [Moorena sp. SIO4A3]